MGDLYSRSQDFFFCCKHRLEREERRKSFCFIMEKQRILFGKCHKKTLCVVADAAVDVIWLKLESNTDCQEVPLFTFLPSSRVHKVEIIKNCSVVVIWLGDIFDP